LSTTEFKESRRQEIAPEILVPSGTSVVSEIMYTTQKTTFFYKDNYWGSGGRQKTTFFYKDNYWGSGGRFWYHYACNIVSLLLYVACEIPFHV